MIKKTSEQINFEAKQKLAKLMAKENITVIHRNVRTASFDLKNRILTLPIFKEMSGHVYNHMIGHEVGHALFTKLDDWTGSISIIDSDKKNAKIVASFLNVVEDARIEKLMQEKYPGLSHHFKESYKWLFSENFFNTAGKDINTLPFPDKVNLHFKLGHQAGITFNNQKELDIVSEMEDMLTWFDVVEATKKLYEYSKSEIQNPSDIESGDDQESGDEYESGESSDSEGEAGQGNEMEDGSGDESGEDNDGEGDEDGDGEGDGNQDGSSEGGEKESKKGKTSKDGESEGEDSDGKEGEKKSQQKSGKAKKGNTGGKGASSDYSNRRNQIGKPPSPVQTQEEYEKNLEKLQNKNAREIAYLTNPKPDLRKLIIHWKVVQENIRKFYSSEQPQQVTRYASNHGIDLGTAIKEYKIFATECNAILSYMVSEFNRKKAALDIKRTIVGKTGDLDINTIWSYKFNDDVFKRSTYTLDGKNHGLIIFFDMSGSMDSHMFETIKQMLLLVNFCRRVAIPFEVYSFGAGIRRGESKGNPWSENMKNGDVCVSSEFHLRQYFSHRMTSSEFSQACENMFVLGLNYDKRTSRIPDGENLGGTPLLETAIAATEIVKKFKKENHIQIVNSVFITDGAGAPLYYYNDNGSEKPMNGKKLIFRNPETHMDYETEYDFNKMMECQLESLKAELNIKVLGFYIVSGDIKYQLGRSIEESAIARKRLETENYILSNNPGYDEYYIIPGGHALASKQRMHEGMSDLQLSDAFKQTNVDRMRNKPVLGRFIDNIVKNS